MCHEGFRISPLLRSKNERCRTIQGVKTFPGKKLQEESRRIVKGRAELRERDGVQELLKDATGAS
jgi:hypothetical protein